MQVGALLLAQYILGLILPNAEYVRSAGVNYAMNFFAVT